jgi:hypothetical protein
VQASYIRGIATFLSVARKRVFITSISETTRRTGGIDVGTAVTSSVEEADALTTTISTTVDSGSLSNTVVDTIQEDTGIEITMTASSVQVVLKSSSSSHSSSSSG